MAQAGQRVCPTCATHTLVVDRARARIITTAIGTWSKAREFYTRWEAAPGLVVSARRFMLAASAAQNWSLVIFQV